MDITGDDWPVDVSLTGRAQCDCILRSCRQLTPRTFSLRTVTILPGAFDHALDVRGKTVHFQSHRGKKRQTLEGLISCVRQCSPGHHQQATPVASTFTHMLNAVKSSLSLGSFVWRSLSITPSSTRSPSPLVRRISANLSGKMSGKRPTPASDLNNAYHHRLITNNTLAGVAQSVERVALITAKRSTSRSWVRAPPSAIPIISSSEQLFFCFLLVYRGLQNLLHVCYATRTSHHHVFLQWRKTIPERSLAGGRGSINSRDKIAWQCDCIG
jgi:hypothetical protein